MNIMKLEGIVREDLVQYVNTARTAIHYGMDTEEIVETLAARGCANPMAAYKTAKVMVWLDQTAEEAVRKPTQPDHFWTATSNGTGVPKPEHNGRFWA